jgi:hypothetical protein
MNGDLQMINTDADILEIQRLVRGGTPMMKAVEQVDAAAAVRQRARQPGRVAPVVAVVKATPATRDHVAATRRHANVAKQCAAAAALATPAQRDELAALLIRSAHQTPGTRRSFRHY